MNARQFTEYKITNGYQCGGTSIRSWDDGTSSNYGTLRGISNCEITCDMHVECSGFVYGGSTDICGYWKRGSLTPVSRIDANCHEKLKGSAISRQ